MAQVQLISTGSNQLNWCLGKAILLKINLGIKWTYHVRNEEVLLRVNEQRNILHEIRKRKANWIGHILRRNCLLKQVIQGKIKGEMEVAKIRGRRRKKLLDDLKDRIGYSHLKEKLSIALCGGIVLKEALDLSSDKILNECSGLLKQKF